MCVHRETRGVRWFAKKKRKMRIHGKRWQHDPYLFNSHSHVNCSRAHGVCRLENKAVIICGCDAPGWITLSDDRGEATVHVDFVADMSVILATIPSATYVFDSEENMWYTSMVSEARNELSVRDDYSVASASEIVSYNVKLRGKAKLLQRIRDILCTDRLLSTGWRPSEVKIIDVCARPDNSKLTVWYSTNLKRLAYSCMTKVLFDTFKCRIWLERVMPVSS